MGANSEGKDAARKKGKPNVLFIAIDDLNDWTGMLKGNPQARTPHMDKLASKGMVVCECPLRGARLRSFAVCHYERNQAFDIWAITSTRVP